MQRTSWAATITFQDVDFILTDDLNGTTFTLQINNVDDASGDWTGIDTLRTFSLKDIGAITSMTLAGWSVDGMELNSSGCEGGGSGGFCFDFGADGIGDGAGLNDDNLFTINYTGTLDLTSAHLKVLFGGADGGNDHGNLLSQSVPVPGTFLLFGLGMVVFVAWQYQATRGRRELVA